MQDKARNKVIRNVLRIQAYCAGRRRIDLEHAADYLGMSPRQLRRYLESFEDCGEVVPEFRNRRLAEWAA